MSGWLCSFSCQLLRFLLMNNADGCAACTSCNMQVEQPLRNVNLFTPRKNLNKFTNKRKILLDCRNLAGGESHFSCITLRRILLQHIFASRRGQTSAVSVPFIFIESAMSAWWWGRVEMDHRGRIDETEENYSAFKTRFIKANGNLGTEYTFPAFTHDSTVMMWYFFLDVKILPRYSGRGTFRPHLSTQEFISLESHPETCCYDDYMTMPVHLRALQSGLVYQKYHKNEWTEDLYSIPLLSSNIANMLS